MQFGVQMYFFDSVHVSQSLSSTNHMGKWKLSSKSLLRLSNKYFQNISFLWKKISSPYFQYKDTPSGFSAVWHGENGHSPLTCAPGAEGTAAPWGAHGDPLWLEVELCSANGTIFWTASYSFVPKLWLSLGFQGWTRSRRCQPRMSWLPAVKAAMRPRCCTAQVTAVMSEP